MADIEDIVTSREVAINLDAGEARERSQKRRLTNTVATRQLPEITGLYAQRDILEQLPQSLVNR